MEKTYTFSSPVVAIACRHKDKQIIVAESCGTISWIGLKDGLRFTMYTQYEITAIGCGGDMLYVGCKDGEIHRIQYDSSVRLKCRYLHCTFLSWRPRDLKRHLTDEHIEQIRESADDSTVVVCKWESCMAVISTDVKMMRRHFNEHVDAESQQNAKT